MTPTQWLAEKLDRLCDQSVADPRLPDWADKRVQMIAAYARAMAAYLDDETIADIFAGEAQADGQDWCAVDPDTDE